MADRSVEQRRQRRVLAGALAGAVALGVVGVAAAALLAGGPCDDLLPPAETSPAAVVDGEQVLRRVAPAADGPAVAADVVALGERLGLGPVRGATPAGADATLVPFEEGVFGVADGEHVRLVDTAIVAVATGRRHLPGVTVVPAGEQLGVVATGSAAGAPADGRTRIARYDEDLRLGACRELPGPGRVLALSDAAAVVADGAAVEAVRLDGGELWRVTRAVSAPVTDAAVTGRLVVVAGGTEVAAFDLRSGAPVWRTTVGTGLVEDAVLVAGDDVVFVASPGSVSRVDAGTGEVLGTTAVPGRPVGAVSTRDGVAVAAGDQLVTFDAVGAAPVPLPAPATGPLAARGADVLVATAAGLVRVRADGTVDTGPGLPVTAVGVSGAYTVVAIDVGGGLLAFYGPAAPPGASAVSTSGD